MTSTWRHAPMGRTRPRGTPQAGARLAHEHLGRRGRRRTDVYASDHSEVQRSGRFRWLISTCIAAAVGVVAVMVVIAGSIDQHSAASLIPELRPSQDLPQTAFRVPAQRADGLNWSLPKSDKLLIASGALSTKFIVQETMRRKQGRQEFIVNKPFARIVARLAPVPAAAADRIPAFNPYKLYGNGTDQSRSQSGPTANDESQGLVARIVDLVAGLLPAEDGQEIEVADAAEIASKLLVPDEDPSAIRPSFRPDGTNRFAAAVATGATAAPRGAAAAGQQAPVNTTVLGKSIFEQDDADDDDQGNRELNVVRLRKGDSILGILTRFGAEAWQARAMEGAAKTVLGDAPLPTNAEMHVTLVPSLTQANRQEAVRFSLYAEGQVHKVTVARNASGDFTASASPIDERMVRVAMDGIQENNQAKSLYTSVYHAAQSQDLTHEAIMQILAVHAFETDFRRRVRAGDQIEMFYDVHDEEKGADGGLGDLLATSLTTAGETHRFYRFRMPDGSIDYFDDYGNTSRKFLMRRPVRGENARLASGFGMRRHPILGFVRLHAGVDWAAPIGTPIMAAGNGIIEEAGRKGEFGNHVRIRHPNGYKTTYSHMSRFAPGLTAGSRVRQGQLIGNVGNTGLSAGPHVHFEVLVNNQHVDPMSIQVPRERQLAGRQLQEFLKERARIEELMRRVPVSSRVADAAGGK